MRRWLIEQWKQIRGNAKYDFVKFAGAIMISTAYLILQKMRHLAFDWYVYGFLFLLASICFFYFGRSKQVIRFRPTRHPMPLPEVATSEEWTAQSKKLNAVTNRKFEYAEVVVDGNQYVNCTFTHVSVFYDGTAPTAFDNCTFDADTLSHFHTHNPSIAQWTEILRILGKLQPGSRFTLDPLRETKVGYER